MTAPTFHRRFLDSLPGDEDTAPRSREVLGACWSRVQPTPVAAPEMLHWSKELAAELGLSADLMQSQRLVTGQWVPATLVFQAALKWTSGMLSGRPSLHT